MTIRVPEPGYFPQRTQPISIVRVLRKALYLACKTIEANDPKGSMITERMNQFIVLAKAELQKVKE